MPPEEAPKAKGPLKAHVPAKPSVAPFHEGLVDEGANALIKAAASKDGGSVKLDPKDARAIFLGLMGDRFAVRELVRAIETARK